jgi:hypothetical protein
MKRQLLKTSGILSCALLIGGSAMAQTFTNKNSSLHSSTGTVGSNGNKRSGNSVTVVDINNDGLDDICQMQDNGEIRIEYQQVGGAFTYQYIGTFGASGSWAMCAGDVDKNGYKDIISGYGSSLKLMKIDASGMMGSVITLPNSGFFVQNMNFMDVDGDTWLDIFACDDNAYGKIYRNDGTGNFHILAHSTTSLTIGTGSKSLTVQTNLGFTAGQAIKIGYDGQNYMTGTVTSYNTGSGALVANITSVTGSGTYATWCADKDIVLNTQISTQTVGSDPYDSGNYGTVWTDFDNDGDVDLYIAKCRQAASSGTDPRRRDVLFENLGNGNYMDRGATYNLGSMDQDWTPSYGDLDNDGDFDMLLTKHNTSPNLYINNGTGHFTASTTLAFGSMPMQSQFEDLDNDGFVDVIMTGDNDHRIYHNNGNGTFTNTTPAGFMQSGSNNLLSFATGDLNHDGKIDIYASYGTTYNNPSSSVDDIYWQNSTSNSNHFLTLDLTASLSNNDALGARAYIYGAWGVQTREVRAGESYGTRNSSQLHFGLGTATAIDSVVVNWPSGVQTVIDNPNVDQFLNVFETNPCTLSGASVTANGPLTICSTGPGVTLTANATGSGSGYTYLWSPGGETTQAITVNASGSYAVTITESVQCHSTSTSMIVTADPDETPSITAASDTVFCQGDSVLLTSTSASAYLWSNGATTQSTYVSADGAYSVQTQGLCQQWNSNTINVNTHPAPAPTGNDVTIPMPGTATVTATGNSITWYANATGGSPIATGPSYATGTINSDSVFYAQDSYSYGGAIADGGIKYHAGGSASAQYSGNTTNAYEIFTANQNCVLKTVKVYTDTPGNRTIELRSSTGTVLLDTVINIPIDTTVITLNFNLTGGTTYQLGTNTAANNTTFGFASPRLRRTNSATIVQYPYQIVSGVDQLVTISNSSQGGSTFYYFYDWNVEKEAVICTSPRTPVTVFVQSPVGLKAASADNAISVYPNPASDHITVSLQSLRNAEATVVIYDLLGKELYNETYSSATAKTISTQNLKSGVYELSVSVEGKVYHTRFVVQ